MKKSKKTKPIFEVFSADLTTFVDLPLYSNTISAGFPSPADDFLERKLDLNQYLIKNPSATFLIRVNGISMTNAGIFDGDILIVDRSLEAVSGSVIIGVVSGEFTVKRIVKKGKKLFLQPENENYQPVEITEEMNFIIWGVVTYTLHKV